MPLTFRPIENHRCVKLIAFWPTLARMEVEIQEKPPPQPATPFHHRDRNPRSARQAHRMGART